jgi:hypothetical protein
MDRDNSTGRQWRDQGHIALAETGASKEPAEERPRFIGDTDDFVRCLTIELEVELGLGSTVVPFGKEFQLAPPEVSFGERGASDARGSLTAVLTAKIMVRVPRYCRSAADAETGATALILRHSRER